jgi:hypothetical protein
MLTNTQQLQNTYVTYNSTQLAHDLTKLQITKANRMVILDIKGLYVNILIDEKINITKTLLTNKKIDNILIVQSCTLLNTILKQPVGLLAVKSIIFFVKPFVKIRRFSCKRGAVISISISLLCKPRK